jgi:beta-galactosidase
MKELRGGAFILEGKPVFLYSGELHYFRADPSDWDERLRQAREAGLNAVASYVPWRWHEPEEGRFDFNGKTHPRRGLVEFVRLTRKHGLYFIPRVGPVSNGEMMDEGLPAWLGRDYPEAFLGGKKGATIHHQSPPAYNNPLFLEKVGAWYGALLPLLAPLQVPEGNIPLFQLCNEIGMINWLGKIADRAPYAEDMYRDFLRGRYGSISKQPSNLLEEGNLRLLLDWSDFYKEYYAAYFAKLHEMAVSLGVRAPALANIPQFYDYDLRGRGLYSPATTSMFSRFAARVPGAVFGGAYQMRRLDYENFHDILLTSSVVRLITPEGSPAVCAELQTGVLSDRPRLYPADVELNLKTSLMSGLGGVNCYMFAGGTNEPGMGQFGRYHEWQAPVASDGSLRPHFESLRRFGRLVKGFASSVAGMPPAADAWLGHYTPYYDTLYLEGPLADQMFAHRNEHYFDGLARLCWTAGYQTSALDLREASLSGVPALAVYSRSFMERGVQEKLFEYARSGGRLLFCGDVILKDDRLRPCPALLERLGLKAQIAPKVRTLDLFGQEAFLQNQDAAVLSELAPEDKVVAGLQGKPCGLVRKVGKGRLCLLAFPLSDKFDYFKRAVDLAWRELGVRKSVDCGGYDLVAVLRRGPKGAFLMLANYHDDSAGGRIQLPCFGEGLEFPIELERRTAVIVPILRPLPGGCRIRFSTCEVHSARRGRSNLELDLLSGTLRKDLIFIDGAAASSARCEHGSACVRREPGGSMIEIEHPPGQHYNRLHVSL